MNRRSIHIIVFVLLAPCWLSAQEKRLNKADRNFKRFEFAKAIHQYERLVARGNHSSSVYRNLADANYLNANYVDAAKWYDKLAETDSSNLDVERMHRYANSLRSVGKYKTSYTILKKLHELKGADRPKPDSDGLAAIKEQAGSFSINHVAINSAYSDFAPSFRLDGIVFSSGRDTSIMSKSIHNWNKKRFLNLYTSSPSNDGQFQNVMRFSDRLNTKLHESSTAFTKDGLTVYFTRNKSKGKKLGRDKKGISRLKIYKAVFTKGQWKNIEELPFNGEGYSTAHPTLNAAEDKLYFASDMDGTEGQSDIFSVDIHEDGSFGSPVNLGKNINTAGRETFPYVTEDEVLYFASDGHMGLGGLDIFAVDLKKIETSRVVNLGEPLNSTADDFSFIINAQTKKGYFASNRAGGTGDDDIYALTEVKPIDMRCFLTLNGIVKDIDTGSLIAHSKIALKDKNGESIDATESDASGAFRLQAECDETEFTVMATKTDYEPHSQALVRNDSPNAMITLLVKRKDQGAPSGTDLAKYLKLETIYFDFDKSHIRKDAVPILAKIIAYLREYPDTQVDVRSHTDSRGDDAYNLALSERRAKGTMLYLIAQGIDANRITGKGYGETQLTNDCDNDTPCSNAKHQRNRRSEFIVVD